MPDATVPRTPRHEDDPLLKAITVGLENAHDAGEHHKDHLTADHIAVVLDAHGLVLPVGVTIGAIYEVFRGADRDGFEFTDRGEADRQARYGGQCGTPGEVRTAWRIRGDGLDVITTWKPVNPREDQP